MSDLYCIQEQNRSLRNIEERMGSIDNNLNRIAFALEKISNCVSDQNPSFEPEFTVRNRGN
jgi:archaellum component FlaC